MMLLLLHLFNISTVFHVIICPSVHPL